MSAEAFVHRALIYDSDREFMDVALPFLEGAIAAEEPALVAVPERHVESLRAALGVTPRAITMFPVEQWYATSARTREKWARWVNQHVDAGQRNRPGSRRRRVRLIGEPPWPVGHEAQVRDWARYESVLNVAFADYPVSLICPYDSRVLPGDVIAHARGTHPEIVDADGVDESRTYEAPREFCRRLDAEVEAPSGEPSVEVAFDVADLPALRRLVASAALASGLARSRSDDLVLAVNEIATNAVLHGRRPATLRIWIAGGELVCEVSDEGDGIKDALAGQLTPPTAGLGGRGLWLTRLLCDAVEIRNRVGCTVSMRAATPTVSLAG